MRPLSRLLSVFIALILLATSVATVAAGDPGDNTDAGGTDHGKAIDHITKSADNDDPLTPGNEAAYPMYKARVIISRVDTKSPVYPGDTIKFRVLIIRGDHDIPGHAPGVTSTAATEDGTYLVRTGDEAKDRSASSSRIDYIVGSDFPEKSDTRTTGAAPDPLSDSTANEQKDKTRDLFSAHPSFVKVIEYKVRPEDLGDNVTSRNAPIQFTLLFDPDAMGQSDDGREVGSPAVPRVAVVPANAGDATSDHAQARVKSNEFSVLVTKKPGAASGDTGVTIEFTGADPDEKVAGKAIGFTLVARTTGKALKNPEVVQVMRQRFKSAGSEDEDKDGDAIPVNFLTIPALPTHSTSAEQEVSYVLLPEDIAAQRVEFSVAVDIDKTDVDPAAGTKDTLKATHTFMAVVPEPEPEATPDATVGMTDSATVTKGEGDLITIMRHDGGVDLSVGVGVLTADGTVIPHMNGYIRDNDLGQTYAVVTRDDGMIVRSWISSNSPLVGQIVWTTVLDFYNVPADVVNAIPLDHTAPQANQLVDAGGTWYVYLGGAWRHIPNIATFQAYGFYYCDLTTAKAGWIEDNGIMLGQALPMTSQPEQVPYPSCR